MKLLFKQLIEKICFPEREGIATSLYYQKQLIGSLVLILCILGCWTRPAQAEGSKELNSSGGKRAYTEWNPDQSPTAGIPRTSRLKVYVNAGETINLGSSVHNSYDIDGTGPIPTGTRDIVYRSPNGGQNGFCNVLQGGFGLIDTLAKEANGPLPDTGGYTPCQVIASETGIYEVEFHAPLSNGSGQNPPMIDATAPFAVDATQKATVAAWDITVRNSSGRTIPGRVFANYLALNIGDNTDNSTGALSSAVYIKTEDGYLYRIDFNGLDPFGFIMLSNPKGFTTGGNRLYKSVQLNTSNDNLPSGVALDSSVAGTNKIFFNPPSIDLPGTASLPSGNNNPPATWLQSLPASPPAAPNNFEFVGKEANTPGKAGTFPLGGNFKFNVTQAGSYRIFLDFNGNGTFDSNDRILSGVSTVGSNSVLWDGKDGLGVPLSPSAGGYRASIAVTVNVGEVHFPFLDAENNPKGIVVTRQNCNLTEPLAGCAIVYYDDTGLGGTPPPTGATNPIAATGGINSSAGIHAFSNSFGDHRGIDTWTSVPSTSDSIESGGIVLREADLQVTKIHSFPNAAVGNQITYTVTVTNKGPSDTSDIAVTDNIPAIITNVNWTCAITNNAAGSLTNACGAPSGSGNNLSTTLALNKDAVATFTITGTVSNFGDLSNSVTAKTPLDVTDPNTTAGDYHTNTVTDTFIFGTSPVAIKTDVLVVDSDGSGGTTPLANQAITPGDILEYTIVVTNPSTNIAINNVVLTDAIPANATYVAGSLKVTTGTNTTAFTDTVGDDQAEVNGANLVFRLGTGANATTGGSLAASQTNTVKFRIQVNDPLPNGVTQVSNQALVSGSNFPNLNSNDPDTSTADDPTVTRIAPRLRLVKRITAINTATFTNIINPTTTGDLNDNSNVRWLSNYLKGKVTETTQPGDTIEYTIYFLSDGANAANNATFCDRIPANTNFVSDTFNSGYTANSMGLSGTDRGILWQYNGTTQSLTSISDGDAATYFSPGVEPSTVYPNLNCQGSNTNGAIVVNLGNLPNATGAGTPANSYGFIRFRAKVK
jgi:uncharacterized repeat protein (TIGR01451 family)